MRAVHHVGKAVLAVLLKDGERRAVYEVGRACCSGGHKGDAAALGGCGRLGEGGVGRAVGRLCGLAGGGLAGFGASRLGASLTVCGLATRLLCRVAALVPVHAGKGVVGVGCGLARLGCRRVRSGALVGCRHMHVVAQGCVVGSVEDAGSRCFGGCRGSIGRAGTRRRARIGCRASSGATGSASRGTRNICCRSCGARSLRRRARDARSIRRRTCVGRTRSACLSARSSRRRARSARITRAASTVVLRGRLGGVGELLGHRVGDARGGRGVLRHGVERLGHVVVVVASRRVALRELLQGGDVLVGETRGVVVDGDLGDVDGRVVDNRGGIVNNGRGVVHVVDRRVVHDVVHRGLDDGVDLALVGYVVHDDVGLHVVHDERGGVRTHLVGDGLGHHELLGGDVLLRLVERLAGGRLISEQHASEGARARNLEGADGDDVGVAHAGRGQRRGQHVGSDVV